MAGPPLNAVVKQLEDSGLIAAGKLEAFVPPKAHPKDVDELIRQLVKENHLTPFQAQQVAAGKAKALILGGYTILDRIGAGGMGQVFKAEHRRMKRVVAIKTLPAKLMKDPQAGARFEREVEAAAKLLHSNIVAAHDADEDHGVFFLVMEYVEGRDLSALVKKNGPLPVEQAMNYILQAARGLEFAHRKGVIHRDIKPSNLLLDNDGTVKILDMGLARIEVEGDVAAQAELTGTGAVMGTVDYMSPEQAFNTKHADARADIYSLGCTLQYLLTGKPMYTGDSVIEKVLAHREKPIPPLRELVPGIHPEIDAVFRRMVAKKLEDRYQTMSEVIAALDPNSGSASGIGSRSGLGSGIHVSPPASGSEAESGLMEFLKEMPAPTVHKPKVATKPAQSTAPAAKSLPAKSTATKAGKTESASDRKKPLLAYIGGGAVAVALLMGLMVAMRGGGDTEAVTAPQPTAQASDPSVTSSTLAARSASETFTSGSSTAVSSSTSKASSAIHDPAFEQWMQQIARLPAEKQSEAVAKKLQELNPRYAGKVKSTVIGNVVSELQINAANPITNLSPVRALPALTSLRLEGDGSRTVPLDLGPLRGLRLTHLHLNGFQVTDLTPLKGMALQYFSGQSVPIADISPLQGMPLRFIWLNYTKVDDLSALRGMPLDRLELNDCPVKSVEPLRGSSIKILKCRGVPVQDLTPLLDCRQLKDLGIQGVRVPTAQVEALRKALPDCKITWDGDAQSPSSPGSSSLDEWLENVAALPAEQQVDAVFKKLQELNPGLDGKVTHKIENGVVTEFGVMTNHVADISPVRALANLRTLRCAGSSQSDGHLADLSPLRGMRLTTLSCNASQVTDLSPLEGMPLRSLNCYSSLVSDLLPLRGMPLESLQCQATQVADLTPLIGMQTLTTLICYSSPVSDLSPLKGILLKKLDCGNTAVSDLTPLLDCTSLASLNVQGTQVTAAGVAALQKALPSCVIKHDFGTLPAVSAAPAPSAAPPVGDAAFEQWMQQVAALPAEQQVDAVTKKLQELNPSFDGKVKPKIENGTVTELHLVTDGVTNVSPIRALEGLKQLRCAGSNGTQGKLIDLSPLRGMQLTELWCGNSKQLTDLSPLRGMPLITLKCANTSVSDPTPLLECPSLTSLGIKGTQFGTLEVAMLQRHLPKCKIEHDRKLTALDLNPDYQQWAREVDRLSPEQQVDAVAKKLEELNPGFIDDLKPFRLENGVVTKLSFFSNEVSNLAPIRVLRHLRILECRNSASTAKLVDLSPLEGMQIQELTCGNVKHLADLSPLRGMPLVKLDCHRSSVADLSPLITCPTLAELDVRETKVMPAAIIALQKALPKCKITHDLGNLPGR